MIFCGAAQCRGLPYRELPYTAQGRTRDFCTVGGHEVLLAQVILEVLLALVILRVLLAPVFLGVLLAQVFLGVLLAPVFLGVLLAPVFLEVLLAPVFLEELLAPVYIKVLPCTSSTSQTLACSPPWPSYSVGHV